MVYKPNKAIHPGYVVAEALNREGMTQKNLSERTGLSEKHLSQIINGEASITVETALLLENALGGAASFWINLEKGYQENKARIERMAQVEKELGLVSKFPYNELVKRGYVEKTNNRYEKVENLWKFFAANSLYFIQTLYFYQTTESIAYRKKSEITVKNEAIAAWLRCGELESKKIILPAYSESKLKQSLTEIKHLSTKSPEEFSEEVKKVLSEAGVGLVYVDHFPGTGVSGAVRWINNNPLIQLSVYRAYADIFWFNLYHEIAHLILHSKKEKFIEFKNKELSLVKEQEREADKFAGDALIPEKNYRELVTNAVITKRDIINLAKKLEIHPDIVAGRLCHDEKAKWNEVFDLRRKLKIVP